jgi:drug/metabolite transporter (DMT)-like permease
MPRPTGGELLIFLYMGAFVAGIGVMMWNFGVQRLGIVIASIYLNLIPVVAVSITVALGTRPRVEQLAGGVLVLAGVGLGQFRSFARRRQRKPGHVRGSLVPEAHPLLD